MCIYWLHKPELKLITQDSRYVLKSNMDMTEIKLGLFSAVRVHWSKTEIFAIDYWLDCGLYLPESMFLEGCVMI